MLRYTRSTIATIATIATIGSPLVLSPAAAQVTYRGALSAGRAFMVDVDDPDPSGPCSATATPERRQPGATFSLGVEAGLHRYLIMRQNLPPDVTGWASNLEDIRKAWRVTPSCAGGHGARTFVSMGKSVWGCM